MPSPSPGPNDPNDPHDPHDPVIVQLRRVAQQAATTGIAWLANILLGLAILVFGAIVLGLIALVLWLLGIAFSAFFWIFLMIAIIAVGFACFASEQEKPAKPRYQTRRD